MRIPPDLIEVIIGQLISATNSCDERDEWLRATSLVSTAWVSPSQRRLFSTVTFRTEARIQAWCSRIRPSDPHGVSRHVRLLQVEVASLDRLTVKAVLPHLASFAHLKRLQWMQEACIDDAWGILYTVVNLFPSLVDIDLSGLRGNMEILPTALPRLRLSSDRQPVDPSNFKHFKLHELVVSAVFMKEPVIPSPSFLEYCKTHLRVLDLTDWNISIASGTIPECPQEPKYFQALFEACHELEEVRFRLDAYMGWILGSIPSTSVALVCIYEPTGIFYHASIKECEYLRKSLEDFWIPEHKRLGAAIRKIAERYSDDHPGLKTRVQVNYEPIAEDAGRIENGEVPFFMEKLEEELGSRVTLRLNLLGRWRYST